MEAKGPHTSSAPLAARVEACDLSLVSWMCPHGILTQEISKQRKKQENREFILAAAISSCHTRGGVQCPFLTVTEALSDWLDGEILAVVLAPSPLLIYAHVSELESPGHFMNYPTPTSSCSGPSFDIAICVFFVALDPIHLEILDMACVLTGSPWPSCHHPSLGYCNGLLTGLPAVTFVPRQSSLHTVI